MSILIFLLSVATGVAGTVTTTGLLVAELRAGHVLSCVLISAALLAMVAITLYMAGTWRTYVPRKPRGGQ